MMTYISNEHPGYGFKERVEDLPFEHCLRINYYKAGTGTIARDHPDRCAIALHMYESHPGLEMRDGWNWKSMKSPQAPDVHCFPGRQFETVSSGAIQGLWHHVLDTTNGEEERLALVFFGKLGLDVNMYT